MGLVNKAYTFTNGTTADATQVNQDLDTLYTLVNGNIDSANIKAKGITTSNLSDEAVTPVKTEGIPYAVDLFSDGFIFSGLTVSKDSTNLNQVNVTSGIVYVKQADGSLRRFNVSATNFRTTSASATYYLDFNPDGTWSWNTGHSTQTNYINVATVTSDANANVATVTQNKGAYKVNVFGNATGPVYGAGNIDTLVNGYSNVPVGQSKQNYVGLRFLNMAAGNTEIYKVPTGKKAFWWQYLGSAFNPTSSAITVNLYHVPAGKAVDDTTKINSASVAASKIWNLYAAIGVLKAGDSIVVNTSAAGINLYAAFLEYDETDVPIDYGYAGNIGTSATTIYTVPTGKRAKIAAYPLLFNPTTAAITASVYLVPSGGTAGSGNQMESISVAAGGYATVIFPYAILLPGDTIQIAGSAAGLNAWAPVQLL